ncbi:MAG: DNA-binding response regulator, AraC family [uncultured Cytophagales bacterium]|uniref:histidine kinase n=1 Tax=uncultured Cytophagales bacterium TaxID=158755 RepID=A0A6J4IS93_9SPHI|nr:MAG: DNA-binding response regulator, AraC family [uncultured Cytophagales bacterium]
MHPLPRFLPGLARMMGGVLLAVAGAVGGASAQAPHFERLDLESSTGQRNVSSSCQDGQGFLWFGTQNGLVRYDGYEYKSYDHDPTDPNSPTPYSNMTLLGDRSGRIWSGTLGGGLDVFDTRTETFTHLTADSADPARLGSDQVLALTQDRKGRIWVGTGHRDLHLVTGVRRGRHTGYRFRRYPLAPGGAVRRINAVAEDAAGILWLGTTGGGLVRFDPATGHSAVLAPGAAAGAAESFRNVVSVAVGPAGELWAGLVNGQAYRVDPVANAWTPVFPPNEPPRARVQSLLPGEGPGELWLGTDGSGLYHRDGRTGRVERIGGEAFTGESVLHLYRDRAGSVWASAYQDGAGGYHPRRRKFATYQPQSQSDGAAPGLGVFGLHEGSDGQVWVGTRTALLAYDRRTGASRTVFRTARGHLPEGVPNPVCAVVQDRTGTVWAGTYDGLFAVDPATGAVTRHRHPSVDPDRKPYKEIVTLLEDRRGNLWIGTISGGLVRLDPGRRNFTSYRHDPGDPHSLGRDQVHALHEGRDGKLWVGTWGGGLNCLDPATGRFSRYRHQPGNPQSLSDDQVVSVLEDHAGQVWVGTYMGGLNRLDPARGTFTTYLHKDGLPNNSVYAIREDARRNLWMSTSYGLSRLDPARRTFRNYDVREGLQDNEFHAVSYRNGRGELFFGGIRGFNAFHPDSVLARETTAPVVLTDLQLFNESVPVRRPGTDPAVPALDQTLSRTKSITLPYHARVVTLRYAALDYLLPGRHQYLYQLSGVEKGWTHAGTRRSVTYANLEPGQYTFRVRLAGGTGAPTTLRITITPPWWRTGWAYAGYALAAAALAYGLVKYLLDRERLRGLVELKKLESEKLKEVNALKTTFFTNVSHEFRTPLTLILGPLEDKLAATPPDHADTRTFRLMHRNANRLLQLVNQLLDVSKLEAGGMSLEVGRGDLLAYLDALVNSFGSLAHGRGIGLAYMAPRGPGWSYFDRDKVEKILTNLLSNAFKFTPRGGHVRVTVQWLDAGRHPIAEPAAGPEGAFVRITVADTGVGIPREQLPHIFDRFYQVDGSHTRQYSGTGIGLALTRELVTVYRGELGVESEPGSGATFTVSLPLTLERLPPEVTVLSEQPAAPVTPPVPAAEASVPAAPALEPAGTFPLLLLVEDHEEVRQYVRDSLGREYRIVECTDGEEGFRQAVGAVPDLVISDVMMPGLDGLELCRRLKTDPTTSHIPVILLTGRAGTESRLDGLATGADDYLTKPFHVNELRLRVKNLLDNRQRWQERVRQRVPFVPGDTPLSPPDEAFLQRVYAVVERHYADPDFRGETFEDEMAMGRTQLYRKLKALTGQSPNEFVRAYRLREAAARLKAGTGTVAETAYATGFNNLSYFSKCFREQYGVPPSEYGSTGSEP